MDLARTSDALSTLGGGGVDDDMWSDDVDVDGCGDGAS